MELIYGKCVSTAVLGFIVAGGLHFWSAKASLPFSTLAKESIVEGARTSKLLVVATAAAGCTSLLQYGRYSPRLFELRGEPITAGVTVFSAVISWTQNGASSGLVHRGGGAFIAGCSAAFLSNLMR
jgi:hypothetical protein